MLSFSFAFLIHTSSSQVHLMDVVNSFLSCLLLGLTAVTGDRLVAMNQPNDMFKALCDNVTHAAIGLLTWINIHYNSSRVSSMDTSVLLQSLLCGLMSSAIDIDHFISARSFHLKDATNLLKRPFLHSTTWAIVLSSLTFLAAHYGNSANLKTLGWIILASFLSHHIRDAARRGLWFWPFQSTPPLGENLYLLLTLLLPFLLGKAITFSRGSLWSRGQDINSFSIV